MSIRDAEIMHNAYLHRYSSATLNKIIKNLDKSERRIMSELLEMLDGLTKSERALFIKGSYKARRLISLRDSINELAKSATSIVSEQILEDGKALAGNETKFTQNLLIADGVGGLGSTVGGSQAYAVAMSSPSVGRHVRDWVKDLDSNYRKRFFSEIRQGFQLGESSSNIARRIRGTADLKYKDGVLFTRRRGVETVVRTSMSHIASISKMEQFKSSGVKYYFLDVTFDGRTSDICSQWNADGVKLYEVGGSGPKPPFHPNCRTTIGYPTKREVKKPYVEDSRKVSDIPENQRDDRIGVTTHKTFEQFFNTRSARFKREWLGETRYKLYRDGKYPLKRFVDPFGKKYNLQQLEALDSETFRELGINL